jgi:hypothetical protein
MKVEGFRKVLQPHSVSSSNQKYFVPLRLGEFVSKGWVEICKPNKI